jgi:hypothetical protein
MRVLKKIVDVVDEVDGKLKSILENFKIQIPF